MARGSERDPKGGQAGRVVAGGFVVSFDDPAGIRLERAGRLRGAAPKPRPAPPPEGPFPEVIDRVDAIDRAGTALVANRPVLLHGPPGVGKTTLLKHLSRTAAHDAPDGAGAWPDGTVLLQGRGAPPDDLLQALHRALHASDAPYHATPRQIENGLRDRQALVLIDDVEFDAAAVQRVLAAAPACAFALASESDLGGVDLVRVPLSGLDPAAAAELLARATGREPTPLEAARLREAHRGLGGHPLRLLQTAALLGSGAVDLDGVARAASDDPVGALAERLEASLSASRLRALSALEAVAPASLSATEAGSIAELDDPTADLEALAHRGLARVEGARYRAAGGLGTAVADRNDPAAWRAKALDHLAARSMEAGGAGLDPGSVEALAWAFERAIEAERWSDAVAIAREMEPGLARSGRWAAWGAALGRAVEAARAADDRAGEAWALHERGSRAAALGEEERAVHDLERAASLREALGDGAGAATSRGNLAVVREGDDRLPAGRRRRRLSGPAWAALAVALVVLAAVVLYVLRGPGEAPEPVDAGRVRFEQRAVGDESLAPVAIANAGPAPATVGAATLAGARPDEFEIVRDGCSGTVVAVDDRCWIVVAFRPAGVGDRTARLVVPFEDGPPRGVTLSGLGVPGTGEPVEEDPPAVAVAPSRLDFGAGPAGADAGPLPVAIAHRGTGEARVAVRIEPGGGPFSIVSDPCTNAPLAGGEACVLEVGFRPTGAGLETATLIVRDLGTSEDSRVTLTGSGVGGPAEPDLAADSASGAGTGLVADRAALEFGEVPAGSRSEARIVTVENRSPGSVSGISTTLEGLDAAMFLVVEDGCSGRTLAAGSACEVEVAFEPAEAGGWSARLVVAGADGAGTEVALEGVGG